MSIMIGTPPDPRFDKDGNPRPVQGQPRYEPADPPEENLNPPLTVESILEQIDQMNYIDQMTWKPWLQVFNERQGEITLTDPDTGGMKGSKLAAFSSIPSDVLWELAEHFGRGQQKYPNDPETGQPNWQKGYDWRLNVDALSRHLHSWLQGEDVDPGTGSNHLIAVVWHAMVLRWFQIHGKGKDFRDLND